MRFISGNFLIEIISNEIKVGDKVCVSSSGGGKSKKPTGMRPPRF